MKCFETDVRIENKPAIIPPPNSCSAHVAIGTEGLSTHIQNNKFFFFEQKQKNFFFFHSEKKEKSNDSLGHSHFNK